MALAAGNTVVLKPAEQTPLTALELGRVTKECGLPDGALNIVQGIGEVAGAALAAHPGIDMVSFIGSPETGAKVAEAALDLAQGGYVTFPHQSEFDVGRGLTVEFWVKVDKPAKMPVVVSCGVWRKQGWFLQYYHGRWRWHVGGVDCDGGRPAPKRWFHLVCVFDGRRATLFENGKQVASKTGAFDTGNWRGPLFVGQYSGRPGEPYQVFGRIAGLRIYGRAVSPGDASAWFKAARQKAPSNVLESCQVITKRLNQSMIATKYMKPWHIGT